LAGVMQGSTHANSTIETVSTQDYRQVLTKLIQSVDPTAVFYDPWLYHDEFLKSQGINVSVQDMRGGTTDPWTDELIRKFIKYNLQ